MPRMKMNKWECSYGCNITSRICSHVSLALSPRVHSIGVGPVLKEQLVLNGYFEQSGNTDFELGCRELEQHLVGLGGSEEFASMIIDYYVCNVPVRFLAKKHRISQYKIDRQLTQFKEAARSARWA